MIKRLMLGVGGVLAVASVARADASVTTSWFNETLQSYRASSTGSGEWITSAGRWLPKSGDRSSCSNAQRKVFLKTCGNELTYRPCTMSGTSPQTSTLYSDYNTLTKITVNDAVFTAYRGGGEWSCVDTIPFGGLSMRMHDNGTLTFIGWVTTRDSGTVKGRWIELAASGVAPQENVAYKVTVESDFRTIPTRVRYSVNDSPLKDVKGNEWFSIRQGSLDPASTTVNKRAGNTNKDPKGNYVLLGFNGNGSVGTIAAETTALPVARASVSFNYKDKALERPLPGAVLGPAAIEPNAGVTLGSNLTYNWYLTDAAGKPVPGSARGTGATYVLTADDYCHWVTVDVSDENGYLGTGKYWFSNLPVVYIECKDAKGWVESDDEVAQDGKVYYWADEEDRFTPLSVAVGDDLTPFREEHGKLFLEDVKTAWPTAKKEDHKAYFYITGNAEYKTQYTADGTVEDDEEIVSKIHVRGNSTAGADKKPYKIKLGKKADLFGLGGGVKNKHWTLLANCFDESLMRNKLCYDYSGELGLVYMHSEWVDVVMNGKFVGNYQLCQHIRVAEERINIYDWSSAYEKIAAAAQEANPNLTDDDVGDLETYLEEGDQKWMANGKFTFKGVNYTVKAKGDAGGDDASGYTVVWKKFSTDISGGYIFELDYKKSGPGPSATALAPSWFYLTKSNKGSVQLFLSMNTPEYCFTSPEVSNAVWNCWNDIAEAWVSGTGYNSKKQHYSELCDFDSMVAYHLAIHVPGNNDAAGLSRYAYKDQGGKVFFGPAWDYDYGLDSLQIRTRRPSVTNEYGEATYAPILATGWIPDASSQNFMGGWTSDPYFIFKLREKYIATRQYLTDMVKDGGLIDTYIEKLGPSARANDLRWNNRIGFFGNAEEMGDAYVVKEFLRQRFDWLDQQFGIVNGGNLGTAMPLLTQTAVSSGRYSRTADIAPAISGAKSVSGSPETSIKDLHMTASTAPITVTVAVPTANASLLDAYLNGLYIATGMVRSGSASVSILAGDLLSETCNFLEFRVKDVSNKQLASNVALLTVDLPETTENGSGEERTPVPVKISWIKDAWTALEAAGKVNPESAPKSYPDYAKFANAASPIGKPTALWQDFVADTDPSKEDDVFTASITFEDNVPKVSWSPDRSDKGGTVVRKYTLHGTNDLAADPANWDSLAVDGDEDAKSIEFRQSHKFFKVEVSLP